MIILLLILIVPRTDKRPEDSSSSKPIASSISDETSTLSVSPTQIASVPEIDLSNMPVAMYTLLNPNGWDIPDVVTLMGTFQQELGCAQDWAIDCQLSNLHYDPLGDIWYTTFQLPAGNYEYKAVLNHNESHVYGRHGDGRADSPAIPLELSAEQTVNFYYDHKTGWITDDVNSQIVTVAGNFQNEVGCTSEWQANCFRTWMQDVDGDGIYTYETVFIPGGSWEAKVALDGALDKNYGANGTPDGDAIPFFVPNIGHLTVMAWNEADKTLTIFVSGIPIVASENLPHRAPNHLE